jgi:regulator of protease activity HflC (stomatin/prohibitin superfamily)
MCDCPCCGCITVSTGTVKIVEKCGAFQKIAKPGLNCIVPCIGECPAGTVSMRLQQMEVTCDTKTKDNVFVVVKVAVQYHVVSEDSKIHDAHYRLTNPTKQIESYVFDVVRSSVPKIDLDDVFTTKEEIAHSIQEQLCKSMESFGFAILASPITDINPDDQVKRAMNEINKQRRLRVAAEDEGEAVKIRAIKEAEAVASRTEIQAKADAEAKYLAGQGIARQRQAIMEGLRESVNAFKSEVAGVDAKAVMDLMIVTQYFDMMRDVGAQSKSNAVFLNHSPGALEDLAQAVQKGFMAGLPSSAQMGR